MSERSSHDARNAPNPLSEAEAAELLEVVGRARQGDHSAVPRLREILAARPQIWRHYGELGLQVRLGWIRLAAGNDLSLQECLRWRAADLHRELVGASTSPIVRLVAERVVLAWLQTYYFDGVETVALDKPEPLALLNYRAKRGTQASRQYLTALAAFATLRKLIPEDFAGSACGSAPAPTVAAAQDPSDAGNQAAAQPIAPDEGVATSAFEPAAHISQPRRRTTRSRPPAVANAHGRLVEATERQAVPKRGAVAASPAASGSEGLVGGRDGHDPVANEPAGAVHERHDRPSVPWQSLVSIRKQLMESLPVSPGTPRVETGPDIKPAAKSGRRATNRPGRRPSRLSAEPALVR